MDLSDDTFSMLTQRWRRLHPLFRLNSNTLHVSIPKNAHSWMLRSFQYEPADQIHSSDRYLIILRDPIERWITGIATYCGNSRFFKQEFHSNRQPNWQIFFSHTLIPDSHSVPQAYFLQNVPPQRRDIFTVSPNLSSEISQYLNCEPALPSFNVAANSGYHRYIIHSLTQYLNSSPNLTSQLKEIYCEDYALLDTKDS